MGLEGLEPSPFRLKGGRSATRASDPVEVPGIEPGSLLPSQKPTAVTPRHLGLAGIEPALRAYQARALTAL